MSERGSEQVSCVSLRYGVRFELQPGKSLSEVRATRPGGVALQERVMRMYDRSSQLGHEGNR